VIYDYEAGTVKDPDVRFVLCFSKFLYVLIRICILYFIYKSSALHAKSVPCACNLQWRNNTS